jgi:ferredoxin--NADP+ reductase
LYNVVRKEQLGEVVTLLELEAPAIAAKAQAGQFVIVRLAEYSERIPLTLSDWDADRGTITIIFQHAGRSTEELACVEVGESIRDLAGCSYLLLLCMHRILSRQQRMSLSFCRRQQG